MGFVYLSRGRRVELTYDESIKLAKYIMLLPDFKKFILGGVWFSTSEIDLETEKKSKLPEQYKLDIRTKVLDLKRKV